MFLWAPPLPPDQRRCWRAALGLMGGGWLCMPVVRFAVAVSTRTRQNSSDWASGSTPAAPLGRPLRGCSLFESGDARNVTARRRRRCASRARPLCLPSRVAYPHTVNHARRHLGNQNVIFAPGVSVVSSHLHSGHVLALKPPRAIQARPRAALVANPMLRFRWATPSC